MRRTDRIAIVSDAPDAVSLAMAGQGVDATGFTVRAYGEGRPLFDNAIDSGSHQLKLYTLYSPPNHRDGAVHATKEAAEADHHGFDGETSE